ncbi:MAG TPA: PDZ domain-containing protein [Terriglobales bacterium]|jgi:predicted metalloprotease with PDZ domain|nr:PDZ domain-containing protein [Terriglobales bacterium]
MRKRSAVALLLLFGVFCAPLPAANPPGTITLAVDATDAPRSLLHARLIIPVTRGPLTLCYPKWIPGEHGPTGPIVNLAGLKITANGKPLAWRRDDVDMYAFHVDVPEGTPALEIALDYLGQVKEEGFSSAASATQQLAMVNWNQVLLYPQGKPPRELTYAASLRLPAGWKFATPLEVASQTGDTVEFKSVALNLLIDSPVLSGAHFRVVPLAADITPPHRLDLAADSDAALAIPSDVVSEYSQLVRETGALFGARHYRHYDFLISLSDHIAQFGLEHHQSSDDRMRERVFVDGYLYASGGGLLPHEFAHSWNGKYRRPAGLATADYQEPMKGELLWVYEGLTQYLGVILSGRSGLWTPEQTRQHLAITTAQLDTTSGRTWRPLSDTAIAAQILFEAPPEWGAWRRSVDFYDESTLIWLDADTTIRELTRGRRSLNDFCRIFFGGGDRGPELKTYTFDDVVNGLNQVVAHDWRTFLNTRLDSTVAHAPMGGLERSGWKLVYSETPSPVFQGTEVVGHVTDVRYSLGMVVREPEATLRDVLPGSAAWQAGIGPGMKLLGVNGRAYSSTVLHDAIREAKRSSQPIQLLVQNGSFQSTYSVNYHGGEKYPGLERISNTPDLLGEIIKPLAQSPK